VVSHDCHCTISARLGAGVSTGFINPRRKAWDILISRRLLANSRREALRPAAIASMLREVTKKVTIE
jgi:hypothetical protein